MFRVMVVEDTLTYRNILRHFLVGLGVGNVYMAADGAEALALLWEDSEFDLIVCDWHMEPMDGLALCGKLQEIPRLKEKHIPVLFMTADDKLADPEKRERVLQSMKELGVIDILPKPFSREDILSALTKCAGYNQQPVKD
ncbi:MAG: response regulator [Rhodospirillaceae bacterium]